MKLERRQDEPAAPERLQRRSSGRQRAGWEAQEERTAKLTGGERVAGSGCSTRRKKKGDVTTRLFRVEDKTTEGSSLSVKREWLEKIAGEAVDNRQLPALTFGFDDNGSGREDWMAFQATTAAKLIRIAELVLSRDYGEAQAVAGLLKRS
jgi:hypothetical protein